MNQSTRIYQEPWKPFLRFIPKYFGEKPFGIDNIIKKSNFYLRKQIGKNIKTFFKIDADGCLHIFSSENIDESITEERRDILHVSDQKSGSFIQLSINSPIIPLIHPGYQIYGHWLIDILPRIAFFRKNFPSHPFHILVADDTPAWVNEILSDLCIDAVSIIKVRKNFIYFGKIFICSPFRYHDYLSELSVVASDMAFNAYNNAYQSLRKKIFVSRKNIKKTIRGLTNRDEIEDFFERNGFELVAPEKFTFQEQVNLFSSAEVIAGEAGSGMHNSIFSSRKTVVINLQSARQSHFIQSSLDFWGGRNSIFIFGKAQSSEWSSSFSVDLFDIKNCLNLLNVRNTDCFSFKEKILKSSLNDTINLSKGSKKMNNRLVVRLKSLRELPIASTEIVKIFDKWLSLLEESFSEIDDITIIKRCVEDYPEELRILRAWSRRMRFAGHNDIALEAYSIAFEISPNQLASYIDFSVQQHINKFQPETFSFFDKLIYQRSRGVVSIDILRKHLKHLGITGYAVWLARSGLGDQLMVGAVTSRLCELLGLSFRGIVFLPDSSQFSRINILFNDPLHAHRYLGLSNLPVIKKQDNKVCFLEISLSDGQHFSLESAIDRICQITENKSFKNGEYTTLVIRMAPQETVHLCSMLSDGYTNYLSNQFTSYLLKHHAISKKNEVSNNDRRPSFLLHLRLGDVATIKGISKNGVVFPLVKSVRQDRWEFCVNLTRTLRQHFGDALRLIMISDGFDRTFRMWRDSKKSRDAINHEPDISEEDIQDIERNMRERFQQDFSHFDLQIVGEDDLCFEQTIEQICSANYCVSTSGHFVIHTANALRQADNGILTFFSYQDESRFIVTAETVQVQLLTGQIETDIQRILSSVAKCVPACSITPHPNPPVCYLESYANQLLGKSAMPIGFDLKNYINPVFVETGLYTGNGIKLALKAGFKKIYSIEINKKFIEECENLFSEEISNKKVTLLFGNSRFIISELLKKIDNQITFWLDAHYPGKDFIEKSVDNCPLHAELDAIAQHPVKTHTILIDDVRLLKDKTAWGGHDVSLEGVIERIKSINPQYEISFLRGVIEEDVLCAKVPDKANLNIPAFDNLQIQQPVIKYRSFSIPSNNILAKFSKNLVLRGFLWS